MSVALAVLPDFDEAVSPGVRADLYSGQPPVSGARAATVSVLRPPAGQDASAPLRLTHRGVAVLTALVLALGAALLTVAARSAEPSAGSTSAGAPRAQAVTVRAGDTLWSIAARVAPARDPRAEIADLQQVNHLTSVDLTPGQTLRLR